MNVRRYQLRIANRQSCMIEVHPMSGRSEGDSVFEETLVREIPASQNPNEARRSRVSTFDPITLAGAWPGNESIEDLMAELD